MSVSIVLRLGAFVLLAQHALAVNQGIGSCNATHATELDNLSDEVFDRAITKTQAHAKLAPKTLADMEPLCQNATLLMAVAKRTAESCVTGKRPRGRVCKLRHVLMPRSYLFCRFGRQEGDAGIDYKDRELP